MDDKFLEKLKNGFNIYEKIKRIIFVSIIGIVGLLLLYAYIEEITLPHRETINQVIGDKFSYSFQLNNSIKTTYLFIEFDYMKSIPANVSVVFKYNNVTINEGTRQISAGGTLPKQGLFSSSMKMDNELNNYEPGIYTLEVKIDNPEMKIQNLRIEFR